MLRSVLEVVFLAKHISSKILWLVGLAMESKILYKASQNVA